MCVSDGAFGAAVQAVHAGYTTTVINAVLFGIDARGFAIA
jgi:hypothetical protein